MNVHSKLLLAVWHEKMVHENIVHNTVMKKYKNKIVSLGILLASTIFSVTPITISRTIAAGRMGHYKGYGVGWAR